MYVIKEVRKLTRSYLLELTRENRQPLIIIVHHRRVKKIFDPNQTADNSGNKTPDPHPESLQSPPNDQNISAPHDSNQISSQPIPTTRAGRISKKPSYLQDFSV